VALSVLFAKTFSFVYIFISPHFSHMFIALSVPADHMRWLTKEGIKPISLFIVIHDYL